MVAESLVVMEILVVVWADEKASSGFGVDRIGVIVMS